MSDLDEAQWRSALGRNAERYLRHFRKIAASGRPWLPGWNSAAFLQSTGWFCYRRMYGWAFANLFGPWLVLAALIFAHSLAPGGNLDALAFTFLVGYLAAVFIVVPVFADSLYYRAQAARLPGAKPPSVWTALGAAVFAVLSFLSVLAMVLPQYADYGPRAKLSEAILAASAMRTGVTEFYLEHQRLPDAAEAKKLAGEWQSKRVQSIVWDPGQRAIVVTLRDPFPGKRLALRAIIEGGALAAWKCGPIDVEQKHMPGSCRD